MTKKEAYEKILEATKAGKLPWRKFEAKGSEFACPLECSEDFTVPQFQISQVSLLVLYYAREKGQMVAEPIEFNPGVLLAAVHACVKGESSVLLEPYNTIVESGLANALAEDRECV